MFWLTDGSVYTPTFNLQVKNKIDPGYYQPYMQGNDTFCLKKISVKKDKLCKSSSIEVVKYDVATFWDNNDKYEKFGVTRKRGILLYGPPGCGKTTIVVDVVEDVIARGGIAVKITQNNYLDIFMRVLPDIKKIEKDTYIVVILEDIEELRETILLDFLDGSSVDCSNLLFIGTTNKLKQVSPRLRNRPSRFDSLIHIDYPNDEDKREFLNFLGAKDIELIISNTRNMSYASIKELVISVEVFGKDFQETLDRLNKLKD